MPAANFTCAVNGVQTQVDTTISPLPLVDVILTDSGGAFVRTTFRAPAQAGREMLAIALFAIANGYQVYAVLDQAASKCLLLQLSL